VLPGEPLCIVILSKCGRRRRARPLWIAEYFYSPLAPCLTEKSDHCAATRRRGGWSRSLLCLVSSRAPARFDQTAGSDRAEQSTTR
jgi:hypothetical protein